MAAVHPSVGVRASVCARAVRLDDPSKNEISSATKGPGGAVTQDGKTRWLAGWTNVDALVDPTRDGG